MLHLGKRLFMGCNGSRLFAGPTESRRAKSDVRIPLRGQVRPYSTRSVGIFSVCFPQKPLTGQRLVDQLANRLNGGQGFWVTGITDLLKHVFVHTVEIRCSGVNSDLEACGTPIPMPVDGRQCDPAVGDHQLDSALELGHHRGRIFSIAFSSLFG